VEGRNLKVKESTMLEFNKDNVGTFAGGPENWPRWRKKVLTSAARIDGPFTTETPEGVLKVADGYLAVDASGYPYPIAASEFEKLYELAE
jgi:hypothetical protein